jgi:hypothetical protein
MRVGREMRFSPTAGLRFARSRSLKSRGHTTA